MAERNESERPKKKRGPGRPFQKGQSGNPGGMTQADRDLLIVRRITKEKLKQLIDLINTATFEELQRILDNPETSALTMMVVKVYMNIIETGSARDWEILMNRMVGKVKDETETHGALLIKRIDGGGLLLESKPKVEEEL